MKLEEESSLEKLDIFDLKFYNDYNFIILNFLAKIIKFLKI